MSLLPAHQIPGVYHRKIGDIVVTSISDGYLDGSMDVMKNVDLDKAKAILAAEFPSRAPHVRQYLPHSFQGASRAGRYRLGQLHGGHRRLGSAQFEGGRH